MGKIVNIVSFFISPITLLVTALLIMCWICIYAYSKISSVDETVLESKIESVVEENLENVMNLPSGSLSGKLGFMVESDSSKIEDKKSDKSEEK